jgi:16S rRNA (uracil1498-N3)-methyltransferase
MCDEIAAASLATNAPAMANRYFVDALPPPGKAVLDGDLAHHLGRVLRARPGDVVTLGDGRGASAAATVAAVARGAVEVEVAPHAYTPLPALRVTLAFAVPRQQRSEWLLEHGTEVGVAEFQPLWTARTRPQGERPERWQRVVRAAAGQCDRAWLPAVAKAEELTAWLAAPGLPDGAGARLLASADGEPLATTPAARGPVVWLVGPEGGFTADERAKIDAAGFAAVRLGPHILRTETAALLAAGLLLAR